MESKQGSSFSDKHTERITPDPRLNDEISKHAQSGELPCAVAFRIAETLRLAPEDVGRAVDALDIKLIKCQLGLFGYKPEKKILRAQTPDSEIENAIRNASAAGKLSCRNAWDIASRFKVSKMAVSAACEAMGVKIKPCQLGAF
jgi:hypothetical protein